MEARNNGNISDKIFSWNTYRSYRKHIMYFINYIKDVHPDCTTLKKAKSYIGEWLQKRENENLSAWTIQLEAKALNKLYGISPEDQNYYKPPKRNRKNIKRSRFPTKRDKHFSEKNNIQFVNFCKATGTRRSEVKKVKGKDLVSKSEIKQMLFQKELTANQVTILEDALLFDSEYYLFIKGKGGRIRYAPIIDNDCDSKIIIQKMKNTLREEKLWKYIPSAADIHSYRSDYATTIYKMYARDINIIPFDRVNKGTGKMYRSEVYTCRLDEKGKMLDKRAMLMASKALGHNRIEIVANNYIRGI